jgi:hypothetical protein
VLFPRQFRRLQRSHIRIQLLLSGNPKQHYRDVFSCESELERHLRAAPPTLFGDPGVLDQLLVLQAGQYRVRIESLWLKRSHRAGKQSAGEHLAGDDPDPALGGAWNGGILWRLLEDTVSHLQGAQ